MLLARNVHGIHTEIYRQIKSNQYKPTLIWENAGQFNYDFYNFNGFKIISNKIL